MDKQKLMYNIYLNCIREKEDLEGLEKFLQTYPQYLNQTFKGGSFGGTGGSKGTFLHFSCYWGRKSIVQFLLSQKDIDKNILFIGFGVDLFYNNKKAIKIAKTRGFPEIVQLFEEAPLNTTLTIPQTTPQITQQTTRFISIETPDTPQQPLAPLILLQTDPLPFSTSLESAMGTNMDPLFYQSSLPYAKDKFQRLPEEKKHNLTQEQFYAIYFYTAQWPHSDKHLYNLLNATLSSKDRSSSAGQWKHYLHYLLGAFRKIPKWQGNQDLYRGVQLDLVSLFPSKYKIGGIITWFSFSSTTTNLNVVKAFLPEGQQVTIFMINNAFSGRCIQDYSVFNDECEVLLPPASRFEIVSITPFGTYTFVQMKQIPTLEIMLQLE
eukprot:TRINITY_DN3014_c1_g4_i1.p1 TRINITY_DN3014_c1_g4~~TRINITY_DN3014_c1_g4_i1.p1  ORF type:complete len:378 (+),score=93.72 TRINITY_DN3014_c1_g4_i1:73-1206(+)